MTLKHQMSNSSRDGTASVDTEHSAVTTSTIDDTGTDPTADAVGKVGDPDESTAPSAEGSSPGKRRSLSRVAVFAILPVLALLLASVAGFLDWRQSVSRQDVAAEAPAVQAAKDGAVAILSYEPDTADKDLGAARDRLTGAFRDTFTTFSHDVVIPSAKDKRISAIAMVPAAAPMSVDGKHAVVMVFVNQAITVGNDPPGSTVSSVRVTLDDVNGRWLISGFEPI